MPLQIWLGTDHERTASVSGYWLVLPVAVSGVLFALVSMLTCYIQGRRAMRIDPMVALRYE